MLYDRLILLPYPVVARELFCYAGLGGVVLGVLAAILLYKQSKKRGYGSLFWSGRVIGIAVIFVVLFFSYYAMFSLIDTPTVTIEYVEALLFFCVHLLLSTFVVLILLLAPSNLIRRIASLYRGGPRS